MKLSKIARKPLLFLFNFITIFTYPAFPSWKLFFIPFTLLLITITTKTVNGKVVNEIKNNLDPEHKELNKIYSDFQYAVDGLSL